ncbi:hypothetical protein TNCV_4859931 [Trichonephila clavipes]|nr:hypothetical protein TNCV_4859931 [Trichonephila clavipes]
MPILQYAGGAELSCFPPAAVPENSTAVPENSAAAPKNSTTVPEHSAAVPENSTAVPENSDVVPEKSPYHQKESESAFQKGYKIFDLPNNDSSLGIKEFLLLRKEETIFIFRNELKTYKALKGKDSGWTLDEILRLEDRTKRYSAFRGSSSFIEVPKQIAKTKAIINVINKNTLCFMWFVLAALYLNTSHPNKTSSYIAHLNKFNFDGISFPTPLNEVLREGDHPKMSWRSTGRSRSINAHPGYRGTDAPKMFIEKLEKDAIEIDSIYKKPKPLLPLAESEKHLCDNAKNCYVCDQTFRENNI